MYGIRDIVNLVGPDAFFKGRMYPRSYMKFIDTTLLINNYVHEFKVRSERTNKYYNVKIANNGTNIKEFDCDCEQFKKFKSCKHVAAILYEYIEYIIEHEYVDVKEASKTILLDYAKEQKSNLKKKVNIELEFEISDNKVYYKLWVGEDKLYAINTENKLLNFIETLKKEGVYEFGKKFIYDGSIHYFDNEDIDIINYLTNYEESNYYYRANPFSLTKREFEYLLKKITKKFKIKDLGYIYNVYYNLPTQYNLILEDNDYKLILEDIENYQFLNNEKYIVYRNNLYILNDEEIKYINLLRRNRINYLSFEKNDISKFSDGLFKKIKNNICIDENIKDIQLPTKPNTKLYFDINKDLNCKVIFEYNGQEINYFDKSDILRDSETEEEVIKDLLEYGLIENNKKFVIQDSDYVYDFLDEKLQELSNKYQIYTSKKIDNTNILKKVSSNSNFSIGQDGIMSYSFNIDGIEQEELGNIFQALRSKKRYYKLKNNDVISLQNEDLDTLNNIFNDLELTKDQIASGNVIMPKYRALYIDSLKQNKYKNIKTNNLFDDFITNFKKYQNLTIDFDEFDNSTLRDYQKEGVKWLKTIYKCDLGGILADEMGLGKSIQTISFIKQVLKEKPESKILIVAPTSLIYNWEKEFQKFGSDLKYTVVAESKEKRKEILTNQQDYNIFITTYGLIRNDNDEYENMDFELCIIDEAQMIKNYQANMTKEIKKIKSKCKIALTGTPVENNVTELWSIFDFIMPGYLNSIIKFKEKYNVKDVKEEDINILKNLSYQIKPFILRRKKAEVAKSLPEKIENNIYVELPKMQKMLYLKVLNDTQKEIDELIETDGFQKSRMKVLQLLTQLRQICIDPSVMYDNYDGEKIKIQELINIVKQNIAGGHKILIFSSFKRVLDNVKQEFIKNSISTYMIDGSVKSKERMQLVESFNKDNTNCFLITLKSGGTGLNLTGADIVIHLDIWWNPQTENQATDRAHRIGQTKNVTVIKIVTKGTIEERILELQNKKKILSENLIEGKQDTQSLSSLTEKEIKDLLSFSE